MEGARSSANRTLKVVGFGLLAFAITILAGGIWSGLVVANLQSSPAVPWSVPVMALLLWLAWSYLGGKGWPRIRSRMWSPMWQAFSTRSESKQRTSLVTTGEPRWHG